MTVHFKSSIGQRIRAVRRERTSAMTQADLCEVVGLNANNMKRRSPSVLI